MNQEPRSNIDSVTSCSEISIEKCSQEMEFLVERVLLAHNDNFLLDSSLLLLLRGVVAARLFVLLFLCGTDCHIEFCDLMSILARSRDFDWTSPVEIEVTEGIGQLLDVDLRQSRLVQWYVEVGGQHATLIG